MAFRGGGYTWQHVVVRQAVALTFIREYAGPNKGEGVQWCQKATGNAPPDYWCLSFVVRVYLEVFGFRCPLIRTASCEEMRLFAEKKSALHTRKEFNVLAASDPGAVLGWIVLLVATVDGKPHAHHAMIVGSVLDRYKPTERIVGANADGSFYTTEGNAADPEKPSSRDGNGAYTGRVRGKSSDASTYVFIDPEAL